MASDVNKAFLLDKDEFVRLSLSKILQKYGFQVEEISDLSELEPLKKEASRSLVLADVELEALQQWAPLIQKWKTHFIFMSPQITEESGTFLKNLGIRRMIKKPVEPEALKKAIRNLCPGRAKARGACAGPERRKGSRSLKKGGEET